MGIFDILSSKQTYAKPQNQIASIMSLQKQVAPQAAVPMPISHMLKDRGVQVSDSDIEAFRPLLYGEVSNRAPDKQAYEADVIFNTALNRVKAYGDKGKKKTLSDVLAMPNQYQAYGGKQYQAYASPPDKLSAEKRRQVDAIVDSIYSRIQAGKYEDPTQGAYYYVHEPTGDITYDSKRPLFAK